MLMLVGWSSAMTGHLSRSEQLPHLPTIQLQGSSEAEQNCLWFLFHIRGWGHKKNKYSPMHNAESRQNLLVVSEFRAVPLVYVYARLQFPWWGVAKTRRQHNYNHTHSLASLISREERSTSHLSTQWRVCAQHRPYPRSSCSRVHQLHNRSNSFPHSWTCHCWLDQMCGTLNEAVQVMSHMNSQQIHLFISCTTHLPCSINNLFASNALFTLLFC